MEGRRKTKKTIGEILKRRLPGFKPVWSSSGEDLCLEVPPESLVEAAAALKEESDCFFSFLACVTGIDHYPEEPRFEVVYHLRSLKFGYRLVVKTRVSGEDPEVPSLSGVWAAADWMERETYDLLGIVFRGHPDLRRILMPEDWEGFPLRKDYPLEGRG